jgi:hypothetical protein
MIPLLVELSSLALNMIKVFVNHIFDEGYFTIIEEAQEYHSGTVYRNSEFEHHGFAQIPEELYIRYLQLAEDLDQLESEIIGMMQEQNTNGKTSN